MLFCKGLDKEHLNDELRRRARTKVRNRRFDVVSLFCEVWIVCGFNTLCNFILINFRTPSNRRLARESVQRILNPLANKTISYIFNWSLSSHNNSLVDGENASPSFVLTGFLRFVKYHNFSGSNTSVLSFEFFLASSLTQRYTFAFDIPNSLPTALPLAPEKYTFSACFFSSSVYAFSLGFGV